MFRRFLFLGLALALLAPRGLSAQNATITGTVRGQTLGPVRGAYVAIPDVQVSTLTNDAGTYVLQVPADRVRGQQVTLVVSNVGYRTQELTVTLSPGTQRLDVTLQESAITLDEVVVTGTAGRQERKAQAAVVATINAGNIAEVAPITNIAGLLQSRLPGVSLQGASGTAGAAQTIRIRGAASISLSNEPLVFIDGVRADSRTSQLFAVGGQQGSRLNDLRPEDIESIEVVKGPAAATLYGADASAGVIQIITKKGRAGGGFQQSISVEYNSVDKNFDVPDNYGVCSQQLINAGRQLCVGKNAGDIISDNPLERYDVFRTGQLRSLNWSGRGGGENYGFYFSFGGDQEDGVVPNNEYQRLSGRFNFDFIPNPKLRVEAGLGLIRTRTQMPRNDNDIYGWLGGGLLGNPTTVGTANDGWYAANRQKEAISAYENVDNSVRALPRIALNYTPFDWFTHRLTVGLDMTRTEAYALFPKNSIGWWDSRDLNVGQIQQARQNSDRLTIDYLGNISHRISPAITSDISFGLQYTGIRTDATFATGIDLVNNETRSVGAAARRTGDQNFNETRTIGFLGQWMAGVHDRFFLTVGGRLDQSSAFAQEADVFFSPKVGFSYVASDEPSVREFLPEFVNTLRIRGAYGTTGRSPTEGIVATYSPAPYVVDPTMVGGGVIPWNQGNTKLKPERGTELEVGFETGLFNERIGLEVTYFSKVTKDLILERPIPPSSGWQDQPFVNIGEVVNRGFEVAVNAQLVTTENFGWDARLGFNTLHNEVTDLGDVEPFGAMNRVEEGMQVGAFITQFIKGYYIHPTHPQDSSYAIVEDAPRFLGNLLPTFEGSFSSTMNFFRNVQLYAQFDWKTDFYIYNNTAQFRERQLRTAEKWVYRNTKLSDEERLRRFGPFRTADGVPVSSGAVNEAYIEPGDFLRFRELMLTYSLPQSWATAFRASNASISVGGRNLALWTKYSGWDPEVNSATAARGRSDFLTLPTPRRWVARVNLQF